MIKLTKPPKLNRGDKIAAVSLSWGGAGDDEILWRYNQGKERIKELFGLEVVEMPHTLKGSNFIYNNPKERADDLMQAFSDPTIKGIFSCIGGNDTIRLMPYIDYDIIKNNPKVFLGYSDTTVNHFMCYKTGLSSFYGPAILSDFAENVSMPDYSAEWVNKVLFSTEPIGNIEQSDTWTSQQLKWVIENKDTARTFNKNNGHKLLQGSGKAEGPLIGGCIEVVDWLRGTELLPPISDFEGAILFLETSEDMPEPDNFMFMLRTFGALGILEVLSGIIIGKPYHNKYFDEYNNYILKVLKEYSRENIPVLANLSFGHCEPKFILPYGAKAQIDCETLSFSILESGVV